MQLNKDEKTIEGTVVPFSVLLTNVVYEITDDDEIDFAAKMPECEMEVDVLGRDGEGNLVFVWDLRFEHPSLFILEASYEAVVEVTGQGVIDRERLGIDTSFPIISEFSVLISSLTKTLTGLPYILGPLELLDLIFDLYDCDDELS